jgi:glycosyltransferase involved in cell wall biosynthesis
MISGRDIVFISSIEWDFLWQIHQEIAFRFALAGNRVFYIENTGLRAPRWHESSRVVSRLQRWLRSLFSGGVREVAPNIFVTSPLVMPPFGPRGARVINRRVLLPAIRRAARKMGIRDALLWTYLPTDTAVDLIRLLSTPKSVVMYYCGADFPLLTANAERCRESENDLLRLTDLVFTTCSQLTERCQGWNQSVHIVPAVVDLDAFPAPQLNGRMAAASEQTGKDGPTGADCLSDLGRPIIGYVGGLHRFVDYDLLTQMIRARPEWSWVFVGSTTTDTGLLAELPNAHLLGQRPHAHLAEFISRFDVCLVPYANHALTATVVPMKVNEYLAMGKPIVSTELPTVREFNDKHRILITAPNEPGPFLQAIELALSLPKDENIVSRRREVAALGDSQMCLNAISELIEVKVRERASKEMRGGNEHPTLV